MRQQHTFVSVGQYTAAPRVPMTMEGKEAPEQNRPHPIPYNQGEMPPPRIPPMLRSRTNPPPA
eukprot:8337834-Ditylum_brightwellii.AAC.1